jgi:hypothetical protein
MNSPAGLLLKLCDLTDVKSEKEYRGAPLEEQDPRPRHGQTAAAYGRANEVGPKP